MVDAHIRADRARVPVGPGVDRIRPVVASFPHHGVDGEFLHIGELQTVWPHYVGVVVSDLGGDYVQDAFGVFESDRRPYWIGVL